ncbi:transmembrane GTPase Marf-like [Chelonus insularis]|uniref:transmembrane GTPase Marf-like n=1 Tax=Chelonus insularis TaxID=460826 RepID=UPI001589C54E|nr:transmembrane GTPase Marf-like [Chelonus insularis]
MAAYINRTVSMIGGDSQLRVNDARIDNSPLQIFVKAKKKINDIFGEIEDYVQDTMIFMESLQDDHNIIKKEEIENIKGYVNKVHGIRDVLKRDHMKVAFFGRTSNGKSTVINAKLNSVHIKIFISIRKQSRVDYNTSDKFCILHNYTI